MSGAQCTVFKGFFDNLPPENWYLHFLGSNGCKWVQINNQGQRIPSNIYFEANEATEGFRTLKKIVARLQMGVSGLQMGF